MKGTKSKTTASTTAPSTKVPSKGASAAQPTPTPQTGQRNPTTASKSYFK